jgi:protease-4
MGGIAPLFALGERPPIWYTSPETICGAYSAASFLLNKEQRTMEEQQSPRPAQPAPPARGAGRGWLIALSIIGGIVLACVFLPLGALAVLSFAGADAAGGSLPASAWQEEIVAGSGADRIVLIEVNGVIGAPDGASVFSEQLTHEQLLAQIRKAAGDTRVKAVVLQVNSPGGSVVASSEIRTELKQLRTAGKHLVVVMGETAASGGYYIATPAERIYANADTLTGSLGVIVSLTNLQEAFDKIGLRQIVYKSGEFKDIGSPVRQPTPEEEAIWQALVDQAYQGFVDVIVEGRGLPRDEVLRIADGRIYTGRQALDLKLIDALGGREEAIAGARELADLDQALVVRYRSRNSLRALLASRLAQPSDPLGLRALAAPHGPRLEYRLVP